MVRCPSCGTAQSPWAPRCEACGTDLAGATPVEERPPRHRRLDRRLVVVGTLLVGLAVAVVVSLAPDRAPAGHRSPRPPAPGGALRTLLTHNKVPITIVDVDGSGRLIAHDLGAGTTRILAPDAAGWPEGPTTVDGQILYISAGTVHEPGQAFPFTTADVLVPVGDMGEVWATSLTDHGPTTARLLQAQAGWGPVEDVALTAGETPAAATLGSLVTVSGTQVLVRDANTGRVVVRSGPVGAAYDVVGADLGTVDFVRSGCGVGCPIERIDARTGVAQTLLPPATTDGFIGGGAISPTGTVAAFAVIPGGAAGPAAELVLIDASHAERVVDAPLTIGDPAGAAAWDPTGRWLVFGGLRATYLLDTTTLEVTRLPFVAGYGFTVAPG